MMEASIGSEPVGAWLDGARAPATRTSSGSSQDSGCRPVIPINQNKIIFMGDELIWSLHLNYYLRHIHLCPPNQEADIHLFQSIITLEGEEHYTWFEKIERKQSASLHLVMGRVCRKESEHIDIEMTRIFIDEWKETLKFWILVNNSEIGITWIRSSKQLLLDL